DDVFTKFMPGPDWDFGASPNLMTADDGTPLIGEGQKSGDYWTLRRSDLSAVWSTRIGTPSATGGIVGSTAYDGHRIYGPNSIPGYLWALESTNGAPTWAQPGADFLHFGAVSESNG